MKRSTVLAMLVPVVGLALGGCTALYVGGGASGGYSEQEADPRSADEMARDAELGRTVATTLANDPRVPAIDIRVDVLGGVVTLTGTVPTQEASREAAALARRVDGVERVVNQLQVMAAP